MSDFMSVQPVSGIGAAMRPTPPVPQPQVAKPADSGSARSATDYGQAKDPKSEAAAIRSLEERRRYDKHVLTGPPPAFQASLLEVEGNLEAIMERLNAARDSSDEVETRSEPPVIEDGAGDDPAEAAAPGLPPADAMPSGEIRDPVTAEGVGQAIVPPEV